MARKKRILAPTYTQLIEPVYSVIKELGGSATNDEIRDKIIAMLNLSDDIVDEPHDEASNAGKQQIDLIDGEEFINKLIEYRLGVREKTVFEVDEEFFKKV